MSGVVALALFWGLSLVAIAGALTVLLTRDVLRLALGLGAFLLSVAGFFAYYGFGFLALAELFVYVGGVLVLILFAIMLVHRGAGGLPTVESRMDPLFLVASLTLSAMLFLLLRPAAASFVVPSTTYGPGSLATLLLGRMLPQFEAVGALLLVGLVAVVVVMGGDRR